MALVQPFTQTRPFDRTRPPGASRARGPLRPPALSSSRKRIEAAAIARTFRGLDSLAVLVIAVAALQLGGVAPLERPLGQVLPLGVGSCLALALVRAAHLYAFPARQSLHSHLARLLAAMLAASMAALGMALLTPSAFMLTVNWIAGLTLALLATHTLWWMRVDAWRKAGRLTPNVVVVGATPNAQKLISQALESRDVAILGVFDDRAARSPEAVAGVPVLGDTHALLTYPLLPFVDRIVIAVPPSAQARVRDLIDRLRVLPNAVTLFMEVDGAAACDATLSRMANSALAQVSGAEANERRAFAKRGQDLVVGSLALVAALPVMLAVAVLVRLDSPGPALFRQRRHGFNNEVITVWKFRSMRVEAADATASRQVSRDDDRVTRVGRVIRKLSLDELPQLINVVRGEMSLVGPRPHAIGMKTAGEDSAKLVSEYAWRHRMKPGLTGWAQINGSIGAVDTPEAVRRRVTLDIDYIERQSLGFDLYILAMTLPALIMARNTVR